MSRSYADRFLALQRDLTALQYAADVSNWCFASVDREYQHFKKIMKEFGSSKNSLKRFCRKNNIDYRVGQECYKNFLKEKTELYKQREVYKSLYNRVLYTKELLYEKFQEPFMGKVLRDEGSMLRVLGAQGASLDGLGETMKNLSSPRSKYLNLSRDCVADAEVWKKFLSHKDNRKAFKIVCSLMQDSKTLFVPRAVAEGILAAKSKEKHAPYTVDCEVQVNRENPYLYQKDISDKVYRIEQESGSLRCKVFKKINDKEARIEDSRKFDDAEIGYDKDGNLVFTFKKQKGSLPSF